MRYRVVAGLGLATLLGAPLAFSDPPRRLLVPGSDGYQRAVSFQATGSSGSVRQKDDIRQGEVRQGDVRQGSVNQGDVRQGDVRQGSVKQGDVKQGDIRQDDVDYRDVEQGGGRKEGRAPASLNATDVLLHFYAHQRDEVSELQAQRERFRAMNMERADRVLSQMIEGHQNLSTQASAMLREELRVDLSMAPRPKKPFVSESAIEMIDYDIDMHQATIRRAREQLRMVRSEQLRGLLETGVEGAQQHVAMLRELRRDFQASRGRGRTIVSGSGVEQFEGKDKGKPEFTEQGFTSEVPGLIEGGEVVIEELPPPPVVAAPPAPAPPAAVEVPAPPPAPVVQAPRPVRRPAH
jgi:rubrerythrin